MSIINKRRDRLRASIDHTIRNIFTAEKCCDSPLGRSWERLLAQVRTHTDLLRPSPINGRADPLPQARIVGGLWALALHRNSWLRSIETWRPFGKGGHQVFASLARHLLSDYPIPNVMTAAWFCGQPAEARRRQGWYVHLGRGKNIRKADIPLQLTKRMAHHFMQAPDHLEIEAAFRWSQVRGLGGSVRLAEAISSTRLGRYFDNEEFWTKAICYLIHHPVIDRLQIGRIVDYLHHQRFVPQVAFDNNDLIVELAPPQPRLTLAGRKPCVLLRQVDEWHQQQGRNPSLNSVRWPRSGIGELRSEDSKATNGRQTGWTIRELLSNGELYREGEAMHHCVAGYANACVNGYSSIWSMRFDDGEQSHRVMTIEVDPATKTICQARRRSNASPNAKARQAMQQWADQEGLTIAEYV